jgi:hypothetical protein
MGQQDQLGVRTNDRITLWVYAAGLAAAFARLRNAGVPVPQEPELS